MGAALKIGPGFNEASTPSPAKASTQLLLDLTKSDRRRVGNLLDDTNATRALNIREGDGSIALEINRGDQPVQEGPARLYFGNFRDPYGPCHVLIPGLHISRLNRGIQHDPDLTVKALTVDGRGGQLDWTQKGIPRPCLWYYLENFFVRTPDEIGLDPFMGSRGQRNTQGWTSWELAPEVQSTQEQNLKAWFSGSYRPMKNACPTHRPITERYLSALQRADITQSEKTQKGALFFGERSYRDLLRRT